ncbi:MAG: O-antigen ligase family protein [Siphonobacter sp.]
MTPCLSYERSRNNYLEYDLHFFIFWISILAFILISKAILTGFRLPIRQNLLTMTGAGLLLYLGIQQVLLQLPTNYYLYEALGAYVLFLIFCQFEQYQAQLAIGLVIGMFLFVGQVGFDLSFFENLLYPGASSRMNTGELANYLAAFIPFLIAYLLFSKESNSKLIINGWYWLVWITLLASSYLLILTHARTAWVATAISVSYVGYQRFPIPLLKRPVWQLLLSGLLILISGMGLVYLYQRNPASVSGRFLIYEVSIELVKEHPILGIGFQEFKSHYNNAQAAFMASHKVPITKQLLANNSFYAFNEFLQILVEEGLTGLFLVGLILGDIIKVAFQRIFKGMRPLVIGANASLISVLVCCSFSYPLQSSGMLVLCLFYLSVVASELKMHFVTVLDFSLPRMQIIGLSFIGVLIVFCWWEYKRMQALSDWEQAAQLAITGHYQQAKTRYEASVLALQYSGVFLYNYGAETFISGDIKKSIALLKAATTRYSHSNLYVYLGNNYQKLHTDSLAELAYFHAMKMVPAKLLAKYELLRLYEKNRQVEKAKVMATTILATPVKILSKQSTRYRDYARQYILLHEN